jgi:hypothetical protein
MNHKKARWICTTRGAVPHMVCFDCRVSFKDISVCPHCQRPLFNAGTRFKPPRRSNLRDWKRIHLMHLAGEWRFSYRIAATVRDAKHLLDQAWRNNPVDRNETPSIPSRKPAPYKKKTPGTES